LKAIKWLASVCSSIECLSDFFCIYVTFCVDSAGAAGGEDEIQVAEEKFNESKLLAEAAMHNLLENDVRNIHRSFIVHGVTINE